MNISYGVRQADEVVQVFLKFTLFYGHVIILHTFEVQCGVSTHVSLACLGQIRVISVSVTFNTDHLFLCCENIQNFSSSYLKYTVHYCGRHALGYHNTGQQVQCFYNRDSECGAQWSEEGGGCSK